MKQACNSRIILVWLAAFVTHNLALLFLPPPLLKLSEHLEELVKTSGLIQPITLGGMLVLKSASMATIVGLIFGVGIGQGSWKHLIAYAALATLIAIVFSLLGLLGSQLWLLRLAELIAAIYGYAAGGFIGDALRRSHMKSKSTTIG